MHEMVKTWIELFENQNIRKQPPEVFYEKTVFFEISQTSQENTCVSAWGLQIY